MASKDLDVRFLSSKDQLADNLTKPLVSSKFTSLCSNLNVCDLPLGLRGCIGRETLEEKES